MLNLKPELLWKHFEKLSAIPRGSTNEKAAGAYVIAVAKANGHPYKQDKVGNVIVTLPATPGRERVPIVILQGHLDMVCEKNADVKHDFMKDPIRLRVVGENVMATGTSLGADNGIGVAAGLALMEDRQAVHGPVELLFTIDEETGLNGAFNLQPGFVKGRRLMNLDSEEEKVLYVGCAGGRDTVMTLKAAREKAVPRKNVFRVDVKGLRGGHSGVDIHEQRGNSNLIMARFLAALAGKKGFQLIAFDGGSKRNAIPRETRALIAFKDAKALKAEAKKWTELVGAELGAVDPGLQITVAAGKALFAPFSDKFTTRMLDLFLAMPHGVLKMSQSIKGLVETSTNFAIVSTDEKKVEIATSQRSSSETQIAWACAHVESLGRLAGAVVAPSSGYPGWNPNLDSPILKSVKATATRFFGEEPHIKAIHAGLECGIIGERYKGMDMVSLGPLIENVHSPDERVHIASVERFYNFLKAILKDLQ